MTHSVQSIPSKDGTIELYVQKWSSAKPKAEVLIVHGFLEHSGRYSEFAEYLIKNGINVTTYDFRGHGKSTGPRAFCSSYQEFIDDLETVLETVRKKLPRFLLGHSNGGLTSILWAETSATAKSLNGVVITSPWFAPAEDLPYIKVLASKLLGSLIPTLQIPAELKSEDLMKDVEKIQDHKDDKLLLDKFCVGWAKQSMKSQARARALKTLPNIKALLFIYAGDDKVANAKVNAEFANQFECNDKTIVEKPGEYHEVLNEVERMKTYELIQEWMLKRS